MIAESISFDCRFFNLIWSDDLIKISKSSSDQFKSIRFTARFESAYTTPTSNSLAPSIPFRTTQPPMWCRSTLLYPIACRRNVVTRHTTLMSITSSSINMKPLNRPSSPITTTMMPFQTVVIIAYILRSHFLFTPLYLKYYKSFWVFCVLCVFKDILLD